MEIPKQVNRKHDGEQGGALAAPLPDDVKSVKSMSDGPELIGRDHVTN